MRITTRIKREAMLFSLSGRLTINADVRSLHRAAERIADPAIRVVIIDLSRVQRLDCWGIGQLIRLRHRVVATGRTFVLGQPNCRVRRLLELFRIGGICHIYNRREGARHPTGSLPTPPVSLLSDPNMTALGARQAAR